MSKRAVECRSLSRVFQKRRALPQIKLAARICAPAGPAVISPGSFLHRPLSSGELESLKKMNEKRKRLKILNVNLPRFMESYSQRRKTRLDKTAHVIRDIFFYGLRRQVNLKRSSQAFVMRTTLGSKQRVFKSWKEWVRRTLRARRYAIAVFRARARSRVALRSFRILVRYYARLRVFYMKLRQVAERSVLPRFLRSWKIVMRCRYFCRRMLMKSKRKALNTWVSYTTDRAEKREELFALAVRKFRNGMTARAFMGWLAQHTERIECAILLQAWWRRELRLRRSRDRRGLVLRFFLRFKCPRYGAAGQPGAQLH